MHQCSFTVVTDHNDRSVVFLLIFRNAIAGQSVQFTLKSLMTVQNRMLFDMLWVEKGLVCSMCGLACCIYIPNDTAPDGQLGHGRTTDIIK